MSPVAMLRQAGFGFDDVLELADPLSAAAAARAASCHEAAMAQFHLLSAGIRERYGGRAAQSLLTHASELRRLADQELGLLPDPDLLAVARAHREIVSELEALWTAFEQGYAERLAQARRGLVRRFADPRLRDVLLLSNDASYEGFTAWLDSFDGHLGRHARKMTDLLAMYLQRVTTKNETHSHFGPFSLAEIHHAASGIEWAVGSQRRTAFLTHWAGQLLAGSFAALPEYRDSVVPRRRPLSFRQHGHVELYHLTVADGAPGMRSFVVAGSYPLSPGEMWLWQRIDGATSLAELRALWGERFPAAGFTPALTALRENGLVTDTWEIPVGCAQPLDLLAGLLAQTAGDGSPVLAAIAWWRRLLAEFATAGHQRRAQLLQTAKEAFTGTTGQPANRSSGNHYADRSVLYEEALGPVREVRIGDSIREFITTELSLALELALLVPRIRIDRESALLAEWFSGRFGQRRPVPLRQFYAEFFAGKASLDRACDAVDAELAAISDEITSALLDGHDLSRHEVEIARGPVLSLLARHPSGTAAVCNPDIMFAAADAAALSRGEFLAIAADCHAGRELLTHGSWAPILGRESPQLIGEVYSRYRALLADDEVLVDLARVHHDKTSAQIMSPCPDLEVLGRSGKPPAQVLQPGDLYLVLHGGRLELRARGLAARLRLMAPLGRGPSIRQDPLSPFAFPRHFGGPGFSFGSLSHTPRLRSGRVVLQRERWRIDPGELRRWAPGRRRPSPDAGEFAAATLLRSELGLTRFGFAKLASEPKPVFIDWEAPLLVRQVWRRARAGGEPFEFSEMFPSPDQLWLTVGGSKRTSELRCSLFLNAQERPNTGC